MFIVPRQSLWVGGDFFAQRLDIVNKYFYLYRMDTSNLISQAEFARLQKCSPQWISQLIKTDRLLVTRIGGIPYVNKFAKIKPKGKKKST